MKLLLPIVLVFFCLNQSKAQPNLVPNPSFEDIYFCPNFGVPYLNFQPYSNINLGSIKNWFKPNDNAPLFFHGCDTFGSSGIPSNGWGYQYPKSGLGYVGIISFNSSLDRKVNGVNYDPAQYISVELIKPLKKGINYIAYFYVNPTPRSWTVIYNFAISNYSAYLTIENPSFNGSGIMPNAIPQINNPVDNPITDTANWAKVSGEFVAEGGEKFITIGNFNNKYKTNLFNYLNYNHIDSSLRIDVLAFVDDVAVIPQNTIKLNDTTICSNSSLVLKPTVTDYDSLLWFNGNKTDTSMLINQPGIYWVKTFYYAGMVCHLDSFVVKPPNNLNSYLPKDTFLCKGNAINLINKSNATQFLWSNGATINTININTAGMYWVQSTWQNCTVTDTILVVEKPLPIYTQLADTGFCKNAFVIVNIDSVVGQQYFWQPINKFGSTQKITQAGKYIYTISNAFCYLTDSIVISEYALPVFKFTEPLILCSQNNESLNLVAPVNAKTYLWQPINSSNKSIEINTPTWYWLTVTSSQNCSYADSVLVQDICEAALQFPNAFSANADGLNDVFLPVAKFIETYQLQIYNAWGELVFTSNNLLQGWDGTYKGLPAQSGTYIYVANYTSQNKKNYTLKGNVTLLR